MEACLLATFQPRSLHFLTRGDVFKNATFRPFLIGTHQIPIYRARDGFENLRKNDETFKFCYEALEKGKTIIIFPESRTIWEKKLRTIQKGTAKLAFGAKESNEAIDLKIVPVGVNFEDPRRFQSDVIIKFGEPISLIQYWPEYQQNDREAVVVLTNDLESQLKKLVFNLKLPILEKAFSTFDIIYKNEFEHYSFPEIVTSNHRFKHEFALAEYLNGLDKEDDLVKKAVDYQDGLDQLDINDRHIQLFEKANIGLLLGVLISSVPWLIGRIFTAWPGWIAYKVSSKKVKDNAFLGPIKLAAGILLYTLVSVILSIVLCLKFGWLGLVLTALWMGLGYFVARYFSYVYDTWKYYLKKRNNKDEKEKLLNDRRFLIEELKKMISQ